MDDELIDIKSDGDMYEEHQFHDSPISECSLCYGLIDEEDIEAEKMIDNIVKINEENYE